MARFTDLHAYPRFFCLEVFLPPPVGHLPMVTVRSD